LSGRPWFVLFAKPRSEKEKIISQLYMGILSFRACDLPQAYALNSSAFTFCVDHDPEDFNYQHCEIRVFDGPSRMKQKPAKLVRKHYREWIAERAWLVLHSEIDNKSASSV
jgi:hypothetical protein